MRTAKREITRGDAVAPLEECWPTSKLERNPGSFGHRFAARRNGSRGVPPRRILDCRGGLRALAREDANLDVQQRSPAIPGGTDCGSATGG